MGDVEEQNGWRDAQQCAQEILAWTPTDANAKLLLDMAAKQDDLGGCLALIRHMMSADVGGREPLYCICRMPYQIGRRWRQCQDCGEWRHPECVSACPSCFPITNSSKSLARLGAQAIQDEIRRVQSELDAIDAELLSSDLS
ncbi:unnamed protein product (mitochondrion) [Plasmodiophora brassicae]|uniref:Uncharacterized protein n=1 Tax=Plasmodiophora brassicae TaxID=37360 RepID=A0A3P3XYX1_PLABS|nr:unnamed protein product [Plasmodiophora brassicae]